MKEEVQKKIISILQSITKKDNINASSRLTEDIGLTSLDMMVFICEIEKAFDCNLTVSDVLPWKSVGDVVECLCRLF